MGLVVRDMPREFDESGQFKTTTTLDDVLAAFDAVDEPVVLTSDIAEAANCSQESARQKLTRLFDQGRITRRKFGRQIVWWRIPPEEAEERPEQRLKRLSQEVDEAIVVGDTVYEDGNQHALSDAEETEEVTNDE
jgi:predicted transcriptional regulator